MKLSPYEYDVLIICAEKNEAVDDAVKRVLDFIHSRKLSYGYVRAGRDGNYVEVWFSKDKRKQHLNRLKHEIAKANKN